MLIQRGKKIAMTAEALRIELHAAALCGGKVEIERHAVRERQLGASGVNEEIARVVIAARSDQRVIGQR